MDAFDKKWKRIQDALIEGAQGNDHPRVSSNKTLFGIKSESEAKLEKFAQEIEEEFKRKKA